MSTATKPPERVKLTATQTECHRLVRLLMRAYYGVEQIVIVDCLLDLQAKQPQGVTEIELTAAVHLSPKMVREVLNKLRQDWLVRCTQQAPTAKPTQELNSRGKPRGYVRAPTVTVTWHVDFEQIVNVIKFRHWDIFTKLNKKVDQGDLFYICPTPDCPNHDTTRKQSQFDLQLEMMAKNPLHTGGIFRCELCYTHNPMLNTKQHTQLIPLTHSEGGQLGIDPNENLKAKFNKQLGVILEQLTKVDRLLQEENANKREAALAAASATEAKIEEIKNRTAPPLVAPPATAAVATSIPAPTPTAASNATSSNNLPGPAPSLDDMISVNLTTDSDAPDAKRLKMDDVTKKYEVLPWDKHAPLSLQRVEEERRAQEALQSQQQADIARQKAEDEQKRFAAAYEAQLAKQEAAAKAAAATVAPTPLAADTHQAMAIDEQPGAPILSVAGRAVPLHAITQEDIDQMTPEEFEAYSQYAETEEF